MATKEKVGQDNIIETPAPIDPVSYEDMPHEELVEVVLGKDEEIAEMQNRIDQLEAQNKKQGEELSKKGSLSGWIIMTPKNPSYNGVTNGITFKNGRAFVREESVAKLLENEFGYLTEFVENFIDEPSGEAARSLIDILGVSAQAR